MKRILFFSIAILSLLSCQRERKTYLPESTGRLNSIAVVMDNELWKAEVGEAIRKHFARPMEGVPGSPEPIFSLHQLPKDIFSGNTRKSRNILIVELGKNTKKTISDTLYAKPQKIVTIQANTKDKLIELVEKHSDQIVKTFKDHELKEMEKRLKEGDFKVLEQVKKELSITLRVPSLYKIVSQGDKFFWIEKKIKGGSSNIIIYQLCKSCFKKTENMPQKIAQIRDSIGEKYILGREEGMYMMTEREFEPKVKTLRVGDRQVVESKGLWMMKNFMLGGPFINYIYDLGDRYLVAEGFILRPGFEKREELFELEAIIKNINQ